jgi:Cu/Ag efflux pump CusA
VLSLLLAILASLIVSVTVTPALAMLLFTRGASSDGTGSPLLARLRDRYTPLVERVVRAPRATFIASAAVLVLALAAAPFFTQSLLPSFHDRNLVVRWNAAPGTSEPEMSRLTARVGNELQSIPGVAHVGAHLGRAVLGDQIVDVNSAELWVTVKGDADYAKTVSEVKDAVAGYPGVSENVSTYLDDRVKHFDVHTDTGTGKDITVRVEGPAFGTLRSTANRLRDMVSHIDGVSDLQVETPPEQPNIEVEVDLDKAKLYGLKPGDVRRAAATMLAGLEVGSLFEQQKVFQVVVWSTPESRSSLSSIKNLLIDTPTGGHVRLEDVANVRISPTPTVIERDEVSRRIDIGLNASGRDPGAIASEIDHMLASTRMPLEYHAEVISTYQSSETLHRRMFASGFAVLLGIFLLLQAAFSSWRLAALFTLTLPVSLSGGVLLAFLFRTDMTLATLAGFIAVLAIAVRSGVAVLTRAGALAADDGRRTPATAVVTAAGERLGALVTTAIATMVALVPLMVTGSIPGQELAQPIAIVVFGGLITTTLVTAFLVPAVYAVLPPRQREAEPLPTTEPATT